jgi:hypothetical protein
MFWVALIIVSVLLLIVFFGVTIAGGKAHDRQKIEEASKKEPEHVQVWNEAEDDRETRNNQDGRHQ